MSDFDQKPNNIPIYPLGLDSYIVFDLETTGLNPRECEIIEIAATRVVNGLPIDHFNTLCQPKAEIPLLIQKLTSITPDMVVNEPGEKEVLSSFLEFIGDNALVAHNVEFDVGFLRGRLESWELPNVFNAAYDTLALSQILYPRLINHKLGTLADFFMVELDDAHRAFADVAALIQIVESLWQRYLSLPRFLCEQLAVLLRYSAMPGMSLMSQRAKEQRQVYQSEPPLTDPKFISDLTNTFGENDHKLVKHDTANILKQLSEDGPLPKFMDNFIERDVQIQMAEKITNAFDDAHYLLAEAGTGIGKSFAYLVPAVYWSKARDTKVVVSTKTKNLQEQLFFKDLPLLKAALPINFKGVLIKGRGNYVCRYRFEKNMASPDKLSFNESDAFASMIVWLSETNSGDIIENSSFSSGRNRILWSKLISDGRNCLGRKCPFYSECFVTKIRAEVADANVAVVNHSLLFSDVESNTILGDYEYCIIDEAHSLEKVAADHFSDTVASWRFRSPMSDLYSEFPSESGAISDVISAWSAIHGPESHLEDRREYIKDKIKKLQDEIDYFFKYLSEEMESVYKWKSAKYTVRQRYDSSNTVYNKLKPYAESLQDEILELVDSLEVFIGEFPEDEEAVARNVAEIRSASDRLNQIISSIAILMAPEDAKERVLWMESPSDKDRSDSSLSFAPLDIDELVYKFLLQPRRSVIMTSATLSIAGNFDYIKNRLGFEFCEDDRVQNFIMESPFDYKNQLRFVVPNWLPTPKDREFSSKIADILSELSIKLRRGTLVLFTSYAQLRDVYYSSKKELDLEGISILAQGISGSRSALTRAFRDDPESVLLGTESFWEGVDVPGESLEILMLTKLPFAVPTDPYVAAQMDRISENGGNSFIEYSVPEAVIKFRQGLGRLIRSENDYGVLLVLDKRILGSNYGYLFSDSAPVPVQRVRNMEQLINVLTAHLA